LYSVDESRVAFLAATAVRKSKNREIFLRDSLRLPAKGLRLSAHPFSVHTQHPFQS
jgi:hypothetical protein